MYYDKKRISALLKWYVQEIGEDLIAVLVVDREGLLIEALTREEDQNSEEQFIGSFSALVELVLKRITEEFNLEEVQENVKEAISLYLEVLVERGDSIPQPQTQVGFVEIAT